MNEPLPPPQEIALALVSHTNAGKTTLARTLLVRDVGEVRDEAHVTFASERQELLRTPEGDLLSLWDTPGFGDSRRLARRLRHAGDPLGWFLTQVWDRLRDRAFWSSQRAIRTVADAADVVLYLVNAAEAPQDVAYLDAEMEVLALLERPVIVLLNQLGPPLAPADERAETERWRQRLAGVAIVRDLMPLDAFARCWVQEGALLDAVGRQLPADQVDAFTRLRQRWLDQRFGTWRAAMSVLAEVLARAARDQEPVAEAGWNDRLARWGSALGLQRKDEAPALPAAQAAALQRLSGRLHDDLRRTADRLIALHGLEGRASGVLLERLGERLAITQPLDEKQAGLWGGLVTGALAGLKADVLSGGLTMGGGLLVGGLLGALGGLGLARGVNRARGIDSAAMAWNAEVLLDLAQAALLMYLAVAHYGRGRGEWAEAEHPDFWREQVAQVVTEDADTLRAAADADLGDPLPLLQDWLQQRCLQLLRRLYPDATL
jgi:hypothetical protein